MWEVDTNMILFAIIGNLNRLQAVKTSIRKRKIDVDELFEILE